MCDARNGQGPPRELFWLVAGRMPRLKTVWCGDRLRPLHAGRNMAVPRKVIGIGAALAAVLAVVFLWRWWAGARRTASPTGLCATPGASPGASRASSASSPARPSRVRTCHVCMCYLLPGSHCCSWWLAAASGRVLAQPGQPAACLSAELLCPLSYCPAGRGNDYNLAIEGDCGWAVVEVRPNGLLSCAPCVCVGVAQRSGCPGPVCWPQGDAGSWPICSCCL